MSGTNSPEAVKKLLENMQSDLRALSLECKKKFPPVKEAAESGIIKVKTIAARNTEILAALKENSSEVVQPFLMGCGTKEPKITQLCLAAIQRLMSHEVVSETAAGNIINMLWQLMENSLEELKLLQTVLVLLTTNTVVHDESLSKAIVLCFRLHFTKDNITNNTAAATVRQVVTVVFERMVAEDERHRDIVEQPVLIQGNSNRRSVSTLKPCAKDAYMLFQDLCQLVNADAPYWLVGMTEMTRTFGLELLESVLNDFPQVFLQFRQGSSSSSSPAPVEKPYFPICMRLLRVVSVLIKQFYSLLVTECEIFLSLLVKFLDADKPQWLRAVAVESIHRLCVQPQLLRSFCQSYDMKQHSTKVFRDIVNALGSFIQSLFLVPPTGNPATTNQAGNNNSGGPVSAPANSGMLGIGGGVTLLPAFEYRGTWIPILTITVQGSAKATYLEMLDKVEPPTIPEGYAMSVAFHCLLDLVRGITSMIEGELGEVETECQTTTEAASSPTQSSEQQELQSTSDQMDKEIVSRAVWEEMVNACWCGLLAALSLLLDASTDEAATENILKAELTMAALCGRLGLVTSRDAFITAICKGSLPPHYALTVLNTTTAATLSNKSYSIQGQSVMMISPSSESHQQVVAVGQPLAVQPQGTVMLTSKNIQCMRTLLNLAHCHGAVLGTSWQLVLATLQHLVWILGLKPSSGGALKPGRAVEGPSTVLTTAVMTDLPVISNILSRLFESSQYLDDVSLHHLINALCSLSLEAMDMAYGNNKEPSLFAVAKLLETGLVNMHRIEILWRPLTGHLLEKVCQHPNSRMREWGAEALTSLIKAGLTFNHDPPLSQNQRLQLLLLNPLKEMSSINHPDIRLKQLECVLQILQSQGDSLGPGWPLVLGVMGAIRNDQGESLIRTAFQCLQLVVTDFLPTMPCTCLQIVVDVAGSFGLHNQELNISLTSIGLLWNISDYFFQRGETIEKELNKEEAAQQKQAEEKGVVLNRPFHPAPPFDCLWLCLYAKLGELCVDPRPAVRKSAGQTLFSTIGAHGTLLQHSTWHTVIWKVLFHLLDRVRESSTTADKEKIESGGGNILIHHSRDTAEKQWAETWVLTLAGVARIFNTRRYLLQPLGDFSRAWDVLLDHIQSAALSKNNEVSLAALKSFQEILQIVSPVRDSDKPETPPAVNVPVPVLIGSISGPGLSRPFVRTDSVGERLGRYSSSEPPIVTDELEDLNLWWAAWNTWYRIGSESTKPPVTFDKLTFIPSQPFLTALIQIFPALYQHIKTGFNMDDLQKLGVILHSAVSVPISSDASPFILPSYTEAVLTSLQEAVLTALDVLQKAICVGPENMQIMYPAIFDQLLAFVEFSCKPPQYGQLETKHIANAKYNQIQLFAPAEWVALNYVPFAERSLEVVVDLYQKTACHKAVVNEKVLQNIIKTLRVPLSLKYSCPSESTWKLAVSSLLKVLSIGLPVARQHASSGKFDSMWPELANTFEDFLFTKSIPPDNLSIQEFQRNESIDVEVVQLISTEILPYANFIPKEFVGQIMTMLNKGSIHSQSSSFTEAEIDIRLREEFSKMCFETLLQFSFSNKVTTPQEGYISRMALSVLLKRSQDVLHRYIEDERLSGKCPLPRQQVTEIIFVLKAVSTLIDSLKKTQPENVDGNTWAQVIALYPTLVECITCSSTEVCSALKEALVPFKDFMQPPASKVQNGES
ncbi:protein MON2 homolog isoform X5 [Zalophus californianus]|uniref:Protein MON2 homolog n=1 Tax=Zalophus californianus TaxID=9704 RepID=A0A6J2CWQ6_ZALCA|nr:protein MON2 homolog isoform X5 [Zalophus californianus]